MYNLQLSCTFGIEHGITNNLINDSNPLLMKKAVVTTLCFAAIAVLVACDSKSHSGGDAVVISSENTKTYDDLGMIPDFVEEWDFIRLETSENSLVDGGRSDIAIDGDLIFVFSSPGLVMYSDKDGHTRQEIKVFDKTGKFLNNIGRIGNGPGEYIGIPRWVLNRYEKYVAIFDINDRMLKYGYDGEYLETVDISDKFQDIVSLLFLPDGNLMGYAWLGNPTPEEILLYDKDRNVTDTLASLAFDFEVNSSDRSRRSFGGKNMVGIRGEDVMLARNFSDTVYAYKDKKLYPTYYLDISHSLPDGFKFRQVYVNVNELSEDLNSKKYSENMLYGVFSTDQYDIFLKPGKPIVWDKKRGQGIRFGTNKNISNIPETYVICVDGDRLVGSIEALKLIEYKEKLAEEGIEPTSKLRALFNGLAEDDNPVLITYKLKSSGEMF